MLAKHQFLVWLNAAAGPNMPVAFLADYPTPITAIGTPNRRAILAAWYQAATKDVYFLVGDEAFHHHAGGLVTMNPAIPIAVHGVAIDDLTPRPDEEHLAVALAEPPGAFIDVPRLIYMKRQRSSARRYLR